MDGKNDGWKMLEVDDEQRERWLILYGLMMADDGFND